MKVDKLEPKPAPRAWLVYPENPEDDKRPKIRWVLKSTEGRVDIAGLTKKEVEAVEAFINGTSYIRCVDGRSTAILKVVFGYSERCFRGAARAALCISNGSGVFPTDPVNSQVGLRILRVHVRF